MENLKQKFVPFSWWLRTPPKIQTHNFPSCTPSHQEYTGGIILRDAMPTWQRADTLYGTYIHDTGHSSVKAKTPLDIFTA